MQRTAELILFFVGICLLMINVIGIAQSLRNPAIYEESIPRGFEITLTEDELVASLARSDSNTKNFLSELTDTINAGIAFYWDDDGIDKYNLRVPLTENYLLHLASYIYPEVYLKYEFTDYRKAIERGVGLCSQHAMIASEVLRERGVPSNIVMLEGHVVLRALAGSQADEWWILDPQYGISIPYDISTIEQDPEIVREYYASAGFDETTVRLLIDYYGRVGNAVADGVGARAYSPKTWLVERFAYVAIWVLPLVLMAPLVLGLFRRSTGKNEA